MLQFLVIMGIIAQNKNELALFSEKVNELLTSRFIISEKRIAALLKCVISTPALVGCVKKTLADFSYAGEFARNRVSLGEENGIARSKIRLPVDNARIFTFVFCLLAEFDTSKRDISAFITEYFFSGDINLGYEKFCDEIIRPFKKAGEHILRDIDPESLDAESLLLGEDFFKAERIYLNSAGYEKMITALHFFAKKIQTDFPLSSNEKLEAGEVAEGLIHALMSKNPKMIRLMWLAFKNTCRNIKGAEKYIDDISEQLTLCNLL